MNCDPKQYELETEGRKCRHIPDVRLDTSSLAAFGSCVEGKMYRLVGGRFLRIKVLYQGGVGVKIRSGGIPGSTALVSTESKGKHDNLTILR